MLAVVSAPPADFISIEESQASTPASFVNAPTIMHCQTEADISVIPEDFPLIKSGKHTVYVTSKALVLFSADSGVEINYRDITLHAIASSQERHVYLQVSGGEEEEEDFLEVTIKPTERSGRDAFRPQAYEAVDEIYNALCACAALHPDTQEDDEDQERDGITNDWITENHQFDDSQDCDDTNEQPEAKWRRT